jgi:putative FmdB family regulatory protein
MPFYDFRCEECEKIVEEFFKIADNKYIECCGIQMKQVILSAPGLSDPGGIGQKWTNDGYQMREEQSGNIRTVTEKWEKGKNVIRSDVHRDDPNPTSNPMYWQKQADMKTDKYYKDKYKKDMPKGNYPNGHKET